MEQNSASLFLKNICKSENPRQFQKGGYPLSDFGLAEQVESQTQKNTTTTSWERRRPIKGWCAKPVTGRFSFIIA
jgi:hypothetical protein